MPSKFEAGEGLPGIDFAFSARPRPVLFPGLLLLMSTSATRNVSF